VLRALKVFWQDTQGVSWESRRAITCVLMEAVKTPSLELFYQDEEQQL